MRRPLVIALCFALCVGIGLLWPWMGGSTSADAELPGKIAFVRGGDLWLREGAREKQLTQTGKVGSPQFSADGRFIAFVRDGALWVIGADGTGPWQVMVAELRGLPTWAPTDPTLAITTEQGVLTVGVTEAGPQAPHLVAQGWHEPAWSQDGSRLAVTRGHGRIDEATSTSSIAIVPRTGGDPQVLLTAPLVHEAACGSVNGVTRLRWSADDRWLAFYRSGIWASLSADCGELAVIPTAGGEAVPVGVGPNNPNWFAWAPQGATLALTDGAGRMAFENKVVRVVPMPPQPPLRSLTPEGYADRDPAWFADGELLALTRSRAGFPGNMYAPGAEQAIWLVDPATGDGRPVKGSEGAFGPQPGPDGSLLWVRANQKEASLWYVQAPGQEPQAAVEKIDPIWSYYGQWNWAAVFDWWAPAAPRSRS